MVRTIVVGQILGFIIGTAVLWVCSLTTNSRRATLKTSAIYNAIMAVFGVALFGIAFIFLRSESDNAAGMFVVSTLVTLVVSFVLLMRLYEISFLATLWLAVAMWVVDTGVRKLIEVMF